MIQLWHEQQLDTQMNQTVQNVVQTQSTVASEAIRLAAYEGYDLAHTTEIVRQQSFLYGLLDSSQQTLALLGKLHHSHQDAIQQELKSCSEGLQSTEVGNPTQAQALQQMTAKREHFQSIDVRRQELINTQRFNWTR
jgi:3-hydroxyisobutyrate dehydrogenase-like beta-hydroxyacid dehydrogenase